MAFPRQLMQLLLCVSHYEMWWNIMTEVHWCNCFFKCRQDHRALSESKFGLFYNHLNKKLMFLYFSFIVLFPELRPAQMKTVSCVRRLKSWRTLTGKVWTSSNKAWKQDITMKSENLKVKRSVEVWTIAVSDGVHVRKRCVKPVIVTAVGCKAWRFWCHVLNCLPSLWCAWETF